MTGRKPLSRRMLIVVALVAVISLTIGFGVGSAVQSRNLSGTGTWHRTSVASWSPLAGDDRTLIVVVLGPMSSKVGIRVEVTEQSATTVRLQGWCLDPAGSDPAVGIPMTLRVYLSAPLGDRSVLYPSPNNSPILKTTQ